MSLSNYPTDFPENLQRWLDDALLKAEIKAWTEWQNYGRVYEMPAQKPLDVRTEEGRERARLELYGRRDWGRAPDPEPMRYPQLDGAVAERIAQEFVAGVLSGRRLMPGGVATGIGRGLLMEAASQGHDAATVRRWADSLLPELIRIAYQTLRAFGLFAFDGDDLSSIFPLKDFDSLWVRNPLAATWLKTPLA